MIADVPQGLPAREGLQALSNRTSALPLVAAYPMLFSLIRTTEIPARSGSQGGGQESQTSGDTRP
jgi:hypothetical protein